MKAICVIPTYNEKDNISGMIDAISRIKPDVDILVVDDNSPDGTGELVESLSKENPRLDVIHRKKKEGLGPAYVEAFRYISNMKDYDYVVQMDADFSHSPNDIPRLLEGAKNNDVVIGSRYVKGGGVSDKWSLSRKLMSKGGNLYARLITGLKIKDCTAGFKCYRKRALASLDLDRIFLNGYGFQIQTIYELKKMNFSISEIPIFFDERSGGLSKMNFHIVLEAFFLLVVMRLRDTFSR